MKRIPDESCASICGLFCGACPAFPEECHGCLSDVVRGPCQNCAAHGFADCAALHHVRRCYECSDFPCEKLRDFSTGPVIDGICNHARVIPDSLRMKEIGVSPWIAEKIREHTCPSCGRRITWYEAGRHICPAEAPPLRFERLRSETHPLYEQALSLYRASFPHHEQRSPLSQKDILSDDAYSFTLLFDGDSFVGLLLFWETADLIYAEHFCIVPEKRSQGLGQRALRQLCAQGKTVILEIDPPMDDVSLRRKGFYQRCGFHENSYPHIHPPYHRDLSGHVLMIMSFPARLTPEESARFQRYLQQHVMAGAWA